LKNLWLKLKLALAGIQTAEARPKYLPVNENITLFNSIVTITINIKYNKYALC